MSYPIILAHGFARFDEPWNKAFELDNRDGPRSDQYHYFRGIRSYLMENGFTVYHTNVPWSAGVKDRAEALRSNIETILAAGHEKVNIIAHSMGGLDSRHMLFEDRNEGRIHEKVASLTTISTPHNGSSFADWGNKNLGFLKPWAKSIGVDLAGLDCLTTEFCSEFNDDPEVCEFEESCFEQMEVRTYAGTQPFWKVLTLLKPSAYIIQNAEGDNDGLVSVESAKWREEFFKGTLEETDHLNEIGWWDLEQALAGETPAQFRKRILGFYLGVANELP
ncbi:MAG: hypothetical protein O3B01_17565 [Planctomycetota bacterium]|nr:hypothetical protein [Planctomycetota bacterium]MDA1140383.1 hypothetical protein [Planctomycetota bacterium]